MNLSERLFLAAVFLVAGAVIVVALGALGVVRLPFLANGSADPDEDEVAETAFLLPPPPQEDAESGLLAEISAYDGSNPGLPPPPEDLPDADASADASTEPEEGRTGSGAGTRLASDGEEEPGKGAKKRDPLVDMMKAKVDMTDAGQVLAFLISTFTPRGTKLGEEDIEFLFTALGEQEDYGVRNLLFAHLERIGGEEVTRGVLEFVVEHEKEPQVVARAMATLQRQGDSAAVVGLVNVLADTKNRKLREVAFRSLLGTKSGKATRPLLDVLATTRDPSVKRYALSALSQLGGAAGAQAVLNYASSPDGFERSLGVKGLRDIRSKAAVPILAESLARQSNAYVKQQVLRTLGRIRDPAAIRPVSQQALYGESRMIRLESIRTLATIGRAEAVPTLQSMAQSEQDKMIRRSAAKAIVAIQKQEQRRAARPPPRPQSRRR